MAFLINYLFCQVPLVSWMTTMISCNKEMMKWWKLPKSPSQWRWLTHTKCGVSTTFQTLFATSILHFKEKTTTPQRNISHFLQHSIRSNLYSSTQGGVYSTKLLPAQQFSFPIFFCAHFTVTRIGLQLLNPIELGYIFGLDPLLLVISTSFVLVHMLCAIFDRK